MIFLAFLFCFYLGIDVKMAFLPTNDSVLIREVWNDNLENEFALIRDIVDDYPYIGMDTEFPGVVVAPIGEFKSWSHSNFRTIITNVNLLKIIQLGLTFSDANGILPTCGTEKYCLWQFNFREFNINEDEHASDSIELLINSGINFRKNNEKGVEARRFSELLMSSGVVMNDGVRWLTFHSSYDFAYLLKLLTWKSLPDNKEEFFDLLRIYFPRIYDVKHLAKFCNGLHGGLNNVAKQLGVERVGTCHQAGSDSLLTCCIYMELKRAFFRGSPVRHSGVLHGLDFQS